MPSAASVKVEKPPTNNSAHNVATNNATTAEMVDNNSPIRQVLVIIDHKIRNLEKRKSKLESYRDIEKSGKDLSADQKVAVSKYDEVAMTLDFAREFSKQIMQIATVSEKDLKKKQKKDETSKKQSETSKIREVLMIQDVLIQLSGEEIRKDFLGGTNGACKLEQNDLDLLDLFHSKIKPKRPTEPGGVPFKTAAQKSADHLASTIDGKQKEFENTTYGNLKSIFKNIQKSAYFDKASQPTPADNVNSTSEEKSTVSQPAKEVEANVAGVTASTREITANFKEGIDSSYTDGQQQSSKQQQPQQQQSQREFQEAPSANAVPAPSFPPQQPINTVVANNINAQVGPQKAKPNLQNLPQLVSQQNILTATGQQVTAPIQLTQVPPVHGIPLHGTHVQPTTVRAVEQAFFKQHQYIQQIRPLADVLEPGNFFFLQESELDSPDVITNANAVPVNAAQQQQQQQQQQQPIPQQQQQPQQQPPALQQSQIPNQNFTNQIFPNVVYTSMKPPNSNDVASPQTQQLQQQPHLPAFAAANPPMPLPIVQQAPIPAITSIPQPSNNNATSNAALGSFPQTGKYVPPSTIPPSQPKNAENSKGVSLKKGEPLDQRIPEITDWKPEDARTSLSTKSKHSAHHGKDGDDSNNNEWRDPYSANATITTESGEWNPVTNGNGQDESNTWTGGNTSSQRYQYRQGPGGYRNGRPSGPGRNNSGNNVGPGVGPVNSTTNGYRGRPNSSYQSNSGRSNGNNNSSSNTFYRNNDPSYYQNGSRGTEKSDSYNRSGNYRSRDSRDNNTSGSSFKSGQPLPQRNNNQSNPTTGNRLSSGENVDNRGQNNNSINNNQNQSHRSGNNPRGINAPNKHHAGGNNASGGYGRPGAAGGVRSQPQQTINA